MKELEEVSCEVRSVIDIQQSVANLLNNIEGDDSGPSNSSDVYNGFDGICGGFLNDATYAWLSYGCHLVVINAKTGESTSSWTFQGRISCVCQFPAQCGNLQLLLVGLDNDATRIKDSAGLVCIFDCTSSRVLRAIRMPAGVEQVCIVSGGAEWEEFNDKRPDNILMQMDGIACVVLRNLYHLMIDLQRSSWEVPDLSVIMDETCPAEIEFLTTKDSFHRSNSKHMACNLLNRRIEKYICFNREDFESNAYLNEKLTNTIISSTKIGCLISGCLGRVIIWQNDGSVGWISQPVAETMVVTHLALLEPTDDPRPFYYLWVVYEDDSSKVSPLLRMFALLFERKYCDRGTNLYFNLEAEPCLKFEFELDPKDKVISLSTIERGTNVDQTESESRRGEDSLLLISTTSRNLLFDLNQWYKEQMPHTVSDCKNPNSILACYNMKHRSSDVTNNDIISCAYVPRSLQEFPNSSLSSSEELFYPNSLSLEWIELSVSKLTYWLSRGVQAELLREMALTGPIILTQPSEMFHKYLSVGLVPFNTEVSFSSDINTQRDMLLSLCLEQRWATFLIRCAKEWSDGSAAYMYPSFLKWGIQRASSIKMIADRLCVPLFDQSGNNIGESEVKTLRFCYQQLECLSNIVAKLPFETSSLIKQRRALMRVSMYFQALLWFYDVGLLPESQNLEEESSLPISLALKIPYPYDKLSALYKEKRGSVKDDRTQGKNDEVFFIDELIARECPALNLQWERETGDANTTGYYPPPSLQSLLRSYLTDCDQEASSEMECKHQITIYLLMDLAMLLQGSYPGVDQLIKYPSSFKMSPSLIKLTQAFWLLDHEDYHGFLDMMTGQLVSDSDVKDWHHRLVLRTLIKNNQHKLALMYLRVKKPPVSSFQEQSTMIGLSVEHGLIQSAFHCRPQSHYAQLLMYFFQACKNYGKLGNILHLALDSEEEDMFIKFLDDTKSEDIRLLYYLQRCRYMEANNGSSAASFNALGSKNMHTDMLNAYNATLPDVMKRFSVGMAKTNLETGLEPRYPRPMTHHKSSQRTENIYETVIRKARETYLGGDKSMIPFVTAPCSTLRSNNDRIDINCVMSPVVVQSNKKRTLDQVIHDEEDNGMRTPDRAKRRKLLDDGEAAVSAAFSTPLVKRKVSSIRDAPAETPHSILKIRQLIRNSTSPTVESHQVEITDSPVSDRERKLNRQIRFNIGQSRSSGSYSETNGKEDVSKLEVSEGSNELYQSPVASDQSLTESAVLSDGSFTCANVYAARPRPSLRRSYTMTSAESTNESLAKCSRPDSSLPSASLVNASDNYSKISLRTAPQESKRCTLSASIQSTAILSPNSSFETTMPSRTSTERELQHLSKASKQQDSGYNRIAASTPLVKSFKPSKSWYSSRDVESMEVDDNEENIVPGPFYADTQIVSGSVHQSNSFQLLNSEKSREDVDKSNTSRAEDNERRQWSIHERTRDEPGPNIEEHADLKNGEHFDITDDESSNDDEAILPSDDKGRKEQQKSMPMQPANICDASNITDDESDSSIEVVDEMERSSAPLDRQEDVREQSKFTTKKEEVAEKLVSKEKSIGLDNNNSGYRKTRRNSARDSPERTEAKDTVNTSNLDSESPEVTPRMTRSRRASSITKETNVSPLSSPSKVSAKTTRSRRASSLMKEVLIASVVVTDIRRTGSSGSEESSGTSSPRKARTRRASSVTKDISPETENVEAKIPTRGSTKQVTSVQKELPEPVKSSAKSSKLSSTSGLTVEQDEEKVQTETRGSKTKQSSAGARKINTRSRKLSTTSEQGVEEPSATSKAMSKRGSSVPREAVSTVRTRRAASVAKESTTTDEWAHVQQTVSSPAANTRSRRSSIHSIPEEFEEILSVPTKDRTAPVKGKDKQVAQNSRQRRATSVELSQIETKRRVRSTRVRGIEETILEEETMETAKPVDNFGTRKASARRKRAASETAVQEEDKTSPKPRRTRQSKKQEPKKNESDEQFSFSQPKKTDGPPLEAIGEVPKYMFSPPHTRSKTTAPDHRRGLNDSIPILREGGKEERSIRWRIREVKNPGHYIHMTVHHCRTEFVLPKR
ncbi:unnamed protein product [Xylocopa violacea]|uniref:Protein ELYS n=1 Tax=Xylocopa violacea TaxID=135666 RepID=A0ABP1NN74_XYLVO